MEQQNQKSDRPIINPSQFLLICVGSVAGIIGIVTLVTLITPPPEPGMQGALVIFEGDGNDSTDTFTVEDDWELRWSHEGKLEKISWRTDANEVDSVMSFPHKPIRHHGGVNYHLGGTYQIDVAGSGHWKIGIFQFSSDSTP